MIWLKPYGHGVLILIYGEVLIIFQLLKILMLTSNQRYSMYQLSGSYALRFLKTFKNFGASLM